jgi:hypothetical protein
MISRSNKYKVSNSSIQEPASIHKLPDDDTEVVLFVKKIFTFFKYHNICFLSGTIIFEDNNSKLFNFLTYGILENNNCNNKVSKTNAHITLTHTNVYNKYGVESDESCSEKFLNKKKKIFSIANNCSLNKCFKMQFVFNEKISFLCDQETKVKDLIKKNKSNKEVILYYRFKYNNKKYLFFKLEEHDMNKLGHLVLLINKNRKDTYEKRRENELSYDDSINNNDNIFYNNMFIKLNINEDNKKNIINNINLYNQKLRTGRELFIFEELKNYLLLNYLNDITDLNDIHLNFIN